MCFHYWHIPSWKQLYLLQLVQILRKANIRFVLCISYIFYWNLIKTNDLLCMYIPLIQIGWTVPQLCWSTQVVGIFISFPFLWTLYHTLFMKSSHKVICFSWQDVDRSSPACNIWLFPGSHGSNKIIYIMDFHITFVMLWCTMRTYNHWILHRKGCTRTECLFVTHLV